VNPIAVDIRLATEHDAAAIALAHRDSIATLGPAYYGDEAVAAWGDGLTPELYRNAMRAGETFFVATGMLDGHPVVLGFATHRVDDGQHGTSVYVRGRAARQGVGTALFKRAEEHARSQEATSICIQASLAGVTFYKANGFEELERGEAVLTSGRTIACVYMRKDLGGPGPSGRT
jgi:GNAT superfamily N-acetyltransferase